MNTYPFSVFKRADRSCYSVSFKDPNGKYLRPVSTGKKTEEEAIKIALVWLRDGVPQKQQTMTVQNLVLKDVARKIKSKDEALIILDELKRTGWVKKHVVNETYGAVDFVSFLHEFWDWEKSPYIKEKLRKEHGLHKRHCKLQKQAIALYWGKFFVGRYLGEITAEDIDAFITYMGNMPLSPDRKNTVIKAGTKALRWVYAKGKIENDPTRGHLLFSGAKKKKKLLTPALASAVFKANWYDERSRLGNMIAAVTGMRNGEFLGLKFKDIGLDFISVNSSWNHEDKDKLPKNNNTRIVEIPFPILIHGLVELAKHNPWGVSPDSYVFWTEYRQDRPIQPDIFNKGLRRALVQIGLTKEQAKEYTFHGWRHFYTSYMVRKLERKLLKSQTGHLTDDMIELYSDHEIDGDRQLIQKAETETFSGLLPERPKMLVFRELPPEKAAS